MNRSLAICRLRSNLWRGVMQHQKVGQRLVGVRRNPCLFRRKPCLIATEKQDSAGILHVSHMN
jgi:hypothetical protein